MSEVSKCNHREGAEHPDLGCQKVLQAESLGLGLKGAYHGEKSQSRCSALREESVPVMRKGAWGAYEGYGASEAESLDRRVGEALQRKAEDRLVDFFKARNLHII